MYVYLVRRLFATLPVMAVVGLFVFSLLYLSPGDPAALIAGDLATAADIARIHQKLGLDQPFLVRFGKWCWDLAHGDLGVSIFSNLPVSQLIGQRLEPTLALASTTILFAVALAVPMGVIAAWKAGSLIDRAVMVFAVLSASSFPVFVSAYILIYAFSIRLEWLPVEGYTNLRDGFWPFLANLVLPSVALGSVYMALIARITRTSMLEVLLSEDYIRTAHAKGLALRASAHRPRLEECRRAAHHGDRGRPRAADRRRGDARRACSGSRNRPVDRRRDPLSRLSRHPEA